MRRRPPAIYDKYRVFLSSTFGEMQHERAELKTFFQEERNFEAWMPEDDPAQVVSWEDVCRERIEESEVVLFILGKEAGTIHEKLGKPICRCEYDWAHESKQRDGRLPGMLFFLKHDLFGANNQIDPSVDVDQASFVSEVTRFTTPGAAGRPYKSSVELVQQVREALGEWVRRWNRTLQRQVLKILEREERRNKLGIVLAMIALAWLILSALQLLTSADFGDLKTVLPATRPQFVLAAAVIVALASHCLRSLW